MRTCSARFTEDASEETCAFSASYLSRHAFRTTAHSKKMSEESEKTHTWTTEETNALIEWRGANEERFTGKRNSATVGWESFVSTSGLSITTKQAKKKWNNLKDKYKELRDPSTGKGNEKGTLTADTWPWYGPMDAILRGQHSISPPVVVAANVSATASRVIVSADAAPDTAPEPGPSLGRKRPAATELLDFFKEQAEKEDEAMREALAREEERERASTDRAERFLALFEKFTNKEYNLVR